MKSNSNNSTKFKKILAEILIVTFGVCLGLMLNTWNQNRMDNNQASKYLTAILNEIKSNTLEVDTSLMHHKQLLKAVKDSPETAKLSLNPALLKSVAWELAQNNTFKENIDQDLYLSLAEIYAIQSKIEFSANQASDRMSELNVIAPYHFLTLFDKKISKEQGNQIEGKLMSGWKNILDSWISYELTYLELSQIILDSN